MSFSITDEQYARARLLDSPFHILKLQKKVVSTTMPILDSNGYRNIQTVVAQLIILTFKDNAGITLEQIADVISSEAKNISSAGLDYAYNVIETNQQQQTEEETEEEDSEEDPEKGDWKDREEENHAYN